MPVDPGGPRRGLNAPKKPKERDVALERRREAARRQSAPPQRQEIAPPDQQDRQRVARERNYQRGAAPTGGPGRRETRRAERVIRKAERGTLSTRELQKELRRAGYNIAVDGVMGPQTSYAWKQHLGAIATGQEGNAAEKYRRQQEYLKTALTAAPNWKVERDLFGDEGVQELEMARKRYRGLLHEQNMARLNQPEPKGFLDLAKDFIDPRGNVAALERARGAIGSLRPADLGPHIDREMVEALKSQPDILKKLSGRMWEDFKDPIGAIKKDIPVFNEWTYGPNIAAAAEGKDFDPRWLALEAALIPFKPISALRGALRGVGMARHGDPGLIVSAAKEGYKAPSRVRTYAVGKHLERREASRSMLGRSIERLSDSLGSDTVRAGRERRYSTKFRMDLMEVAPQQLRSFKSRMRRISRRIDDKQEYSLRVLAEGLTPAERQAHHLKQAEKYKPFEWQLYHIQHAGLSMEADKYVQLNPDWSPDVDVDEIPRIILRKDAPRHLKQAWQAFQETGMLRETLLKELARLNDEAIMGRLHGPGRIMSGGEWKTFEKKAQEELEADPARAQAFKWFDDNLEPTEAQASKTFYDHTIRSMAEARGESVKQVLARIKSVEELGNMPEGPGLLFQMADAGDNPEVRAFYTKEAKRLRGLVGKPFNAKSAPRIDSLLHDLRRRAIEAQGFRMWYTDSAKAILGHVGGDKEEAKKLAKLLAIFSPRARVWDETSWNNVTRAIGAYDEYNQIGHVSPKWSLSKQDTPGNRMKQRWTEDVLREEFVPKRDWQTEEANAVMSGAGEWSGIKTNNFYRNFLADIDPQEYAERYGEDTGVTIDTWMRRAFNYPVTGQKQNETITEDMYEFMAEATRVIAKELGWQPREAQAAIWTSIKAEMEGESLENAGFSFKDALTAYTKRTGQDTLFQRAKPRRLEGLPEKGSPNYEVQDVAEAYMKEIGLPYHRPPEYLEVDEARGRRIATEYERMIHDPENPQVKASYDALIKETFDQYFALERAGYVFEFPEGEYPYKSPWDAMRDLNERKHLYVFPTEEGFGTLAETTDHPLLELAEGVQWSGRDVTYNDIFRAVHDVFGHNKEGVGFRASGEENAWRQHSAMYSDLARGAMTTETRGQNSWVNFGPHGAANQEANETATVYADQKAGLLPKWIVNEGSGNDPYEALGSAVRDEGEDIVKGFEELLAPKLKGQALEDAKAAAPNDWDGVKGMALLDAMSNIRDEDLLRELQDQVGRPLDEMGAWLNSKITSGELDPEDLTLLRNIANVLPPVEGVTRAMHGLDELDTRAVGDPDIPGIKRITTEGTLFQRTPFQKHLEEFRKEPLEKLQEHLENLPQYGAGYRDANLRRALERAIKEKQGLILEQRGGALNTISPYGIKGAVEFDLFDLARVFLTESSDVTTFPHEMAHIMRRLMTPAQEKTIAKAMGAKLSGPKENRRYVWDEAAEEKFAKAWEGMIYRGLEPAGAKREFTAMARAFQEVLEEAEIPNIPPHVASMLRKMHEFEPRPGGKIFDAEDILYGVEYAPTFRGMPFRMTEPHKQMSAGMKKISLSLFGGGKRRVIGGGPDDVHLRKAFRGAAYMSGFFKRDVIDPKADSATLAIRMSAASVAHAALRDAGSEIPTFADDIAVRINPREGIDSEGLNAFWDRVSELGERRLSKKDLEGINFDVVEMARKHVLPFVGDATDAAEQARIAQAIIDTNRPMDNILWVPREYVEASGLLYVPRSARHRERALKKWSNRAGLTWDVLNDMVKAQILWLNPAYAPVQLVGNTVMNLMHQGPFAVVSGYKSVMMMRDMELVERLTMDTAMGEGIGGAIRPSNAVFGNALEALHHYNTIVSDIFPRRMAFMHEARRDGIKDVKDVGRLLQNARKGDEAALQQVEMIARRAKRSIVDFDRMSPFERDFMTRWIFFYPWLRGATDYSVNFIKDHPFQAAALALMYEHWQAQQQEILGDHPYYSNMDVPIGTGTVGLKVPWTNADISLSDAVGDKQWRDANDNPMVFKLRQALTQTTPLELAASLKAFTLGRTDEGALDVVSHLTPFPLAIGVALFGYDPYLGREQKPGPLAALNQLGFPTSKETRSMAPLVDRVKQLFFTSPEQRAERNAEALYPRERRHHAMRTLLGSLAPTPYSTAEGQKRVRELKPTLERKTEELRLDAKRYGLPAPNSIVLEELEYRTDLDKGWRNAAPEEKAQRVAEAFDRRHKTSEMSNYAKKLSTDAEREKFVEIVRPKIYPYLLAYERQLEALEDAALGQ